MIRKLQPSDLLPVVYNYLKEVGHQKVAKQLKKESELDLEDKTGVCGRALNKICRIYIQHNPLLLSLYSVQPLSSEDELTQDSPQDSQVVTLISKQPSKQSSRKNSLTKVKVPGALSFSKGDTQYPDVLTQQDKLLQEKEQNEKAQKLIKEKEQKDKQ